LNRDSNKFLISSSTSSLNKDNNVNNMDEDSDSYTSCAEDIRNLNDMNCSTRTNQLVNEKDILFKNGEIEFTFDAIASSTGTTIQPSLNTGNHMLHDRQYHHHFDYQRQSVIRHNQHDFEFKKEIDFTEFNKSVCPDKVERLKKFTICIFVDSFEDYSFNRSHESCDSSFNNPNNNPNQQMSNTFGSNTDLKALGKGELKSMDYIDHGSSMKHSLSHQDSKSNENINNNNNNNYKTNLVSNLSRNFSDYIELDKSQSLKEFEQAEERVKVTSASHEQVASAGHVASIPKTASSHQLFQATQLTDEEFIFSSYPMNFNMNKSVLASKPPLMPNQHQNHSSHNLNANCLSTITEYSNETFETCSNMSSNRNMANNATSTNANSNNNQSCDFDENNENYATKKNRGSSSSHQGDVCSNSNESSTNDFELDAKHVTYRKGDQRKKTTTPPPSSMKRSSSDANSNNTDTCIAELKSDSIKLREILNDLLNKSSELKPHQRVNRRSLSNDQAKLSSERKKSGSASTNELKMMTNLKSRSNSSLSDSCFTSSSSSNNMVHTPSTYSIINRKAQLVAAAAGTPIMNNEHSLTSITRDTQMSAMLTDKLFEKFCMISNDDIMNCSDVDKTSMDVLNQHARNMQPNVKIKSKLLEEVLAAPIEEPSMQSDHTNQHQQQQQRRASSTRNFSKTDNDDGYEDEQEYEDDVFLKSKSIGANQAKSSTPLVPNELNKLETSRTLDKVCTSVKSTSSLSSSEHNNTLTNQINANTNNQRDEASWLPNQGQKDSTSTTNTTTSKHNNVSSTTTLEISSYTSDSLFNSHLMITPLCSDLTMSPANQLGSLLLKSPLLSPSKNLLNLLPQLNSANTTPQQRKQLQQQIDQIASEFLNKYKSPNQASPSLPLPSPPFLNSNSLSTSLQNSSLPPPPPPPMSLPTQTTSSTLTAPTSPPLPPPPSMSSNGQQQDCLDSPSLPTPPLLPPLPPSMHGQSKYKFNHNQKPANSSSFVESLTARFNAIANNEQNKVGTGSKKPQSAVSPQTKVVSEMSQTDKASPQSQSESSEGKTKRIEDKVTGKPMKSPGKSPKPPSNPSANKEGSTPQHWKEANFNSIFGLDTDDEQQQHQQDVDDSKYRDRSKSCDLALEHLDKKSSKNVYCKTATNRTPVGNYQRANENIFPNLSTIDYDFDEESPVTVPEPPNEFKDKELTPPNKSQVEVNETRRKSNEPRQYVSCPNLMNKHLNQRVESSTDDDSTKFKLDHLLNINPKRLYKNCKFRCRIHDVIDEQGRFWLEVLYTKEEERKFAEIFKLFRLCARISPPPTDLYENKRVGALYKGDWHRAILIDQNIYQNGSVVNEKVRVRFIDLGITKMLNPQSELRQVDAKFFNCPPKSLHCSLVVDEEHARDKLKLSKEARKFFTRLIYKKVLFAKIVHLDAKEPTYKIVLGCQTTRGVIDVYMYLLSKFDRTRYCDLKRANHFNQSSCRPIDFALSPQKPHLQSAISSPNHEYLNVVLPNAPPMSPPQSPPFQTTDMTQNQQEFRIINGDNSVMRGFNRDLDNDCGIELSRVVAVNANANDAQSDNDSDEQEEEDDDINRIDEDYELNQIDLDNDQFRESIETSEDTDTEDYALFSDIVDTFNQNQMDTFLNVTAQTNNTSHFSTVNESFMDKLPVKDDKKFNYSGSLKIDSVHLPSIHKDASVSKETTPHKAINYTPHTNNAKSTAKIGRAHV